MSGEGRKAGCWGPCSGAGDLGHWKSSLNSQEGKGEIKAEGNKGERFVANGTQMFPTRVLGFSAYLGPSHIKEVE